VIRFVHVGSADAYGSGAAAFRKGLGATGYIEGRNVTVEYHWLEGQYDRLPAVMPDLVRRRVDVIATPGNTPGAIAAKATTATIPIVFGVPGEWTAMRIEVNGRTAKLFVGAAPQPVLIVNDLKRGADAHGSVGLYVDNGTDGHFRKLRVRPSS
jgi:hypothetical protein